MLSYQNAIDQLPDGEKPSILIANGFSQAWNARIFNYASILGRPRSELEMEKLKVYSQNLKPTTLKKLWDNWYLHRLS